MQSDRHVILDKNSQVKLNNKNPVLNRPNRPGWVEKKFLVSHSFQGEPNVSQSNF